MLVLEANSTRREVAQKSKLTWKPPRWSWWGPCRTTAPSPFQKRPTVSF